MIFIMASFELESFVAFLSIIILFLFVVLFTKLSFLNFEQNQREISFKLTQFPKNSLEQNLICSSTRVPLIHFSFYTTNISFDEFYIFLALVNAQTRNSSMLLLINRTHGSGLKEMSLYQELQPLIINKYDNYMLNNFYLIRLGIYQKRIA